MRYSQGEADVFNALKSTLARIMSSEPAVGDARALLTKLEGSTRLSSSRKIFKVPFASSVIVTSVGITPTPPTPFVFPFDCRVIGMKGSVVEGLSLLSHVAVSIIDENGVPLFTNGGQAGQSSTSVPITFVGLQGNSADQSGFNRELFDRDVKANSQWMIQCTSVESLPASGSTTYTPELLLLIELTGSQGRQSF